MDNQHSLQKTVSADNQLAVKQQIHSQVLQRLGTSDERAAYTLMAAGQPLRNMDDPALQTATREITGAITVLTGCQIEPLLVKITLGTVKKFLAANFGFLTVAEIQEAFTMNSTGKLGRRVQHYNRSMNCDYIGEVLGLYAEHRAALMPGIISVYNQVVPALPAPDDGANCRVTDADRKEILEQAYAMYRKVPTMELFGVERLYEYLSLFDLVTPDAFQGYSDMAKAKMIANTFMQVSAIAHTERLGEKVELQTRLDELNGHKPVSDTTARMRVIKAKDIVVRKLFKDLVDGHRETIFA